MQLPDRRRKSEDRRVLRPLPFRGERLGRRADADGNDVQNHIIGNCRITPIEVFEKRFPVTVPTYELIPIPVAPGGFAAAWRSVA